MKNSSFLCLQDYNELIEVYDNEAEIKNWQAFKSGDAEAYAAIYRNNVSAMYRYGLSLVSISEHFVFDCIHDIFTDLWQKQRTIATPQNVRHYLLTSLRNRIINHIQRDRNRFVTTESNELESLWEYAIDEEVHPTTEQPDKLEMLKELIAQLPPRQQEVVRLRIEEELDFQQVATTMDINRQSAQNLFLRATKKLRELFS